MNKRVIIDIIGGVANPHQIPEGVEVELRDYDVEGDEHLDMKTDKNGDKYLEIIYSSTEK